MKIFVLFISIVLLTTLMAMGFPEMEKVSEDCNKVIALPHGKAYLTEEDIARAKL